MECVSHAASPIVDRLWDFGDGIPEVTARPTHTFGQPGKHRVTLVVWDQAGRGGRVEKMIEVQRRQRDESRKKKHHGDTESTEGSAK